MDTGLRRYDEVGQLGAAGLSGLVWHLPGYDGSFVGVVRFNTALVRRGVFVFCRRPSVCLA